MRPAAGPAAVGAALTLTTWLLPGVAQATTAPDTSPQGLVASVERTDDGLDVVFQASNLPPGARIALNSIRVQADGEPIAAKSSRITARSNLARTAVLAIDTSRSMGGRLDDAKAAAQAYVDALPADVRVGIVTFDVTYAVAQPPTRNHALVSDVISSLELAPRDGTALFDGVQRAVGLAGTGGTSNVLLVTDGANSRSTATKREAKDVVTESGVGIDAVYIGKRPTPPPDLADLVGSAHVFSADSGQLATIYRSAARSIVNQVRITVTTPEELAGRSVNLAVRARAGPIVLRDDVLATFGAAAVDVPPRPAGRGLAARLAPPAVLPVALLLLFLSLSALLAIAFTRGDAGGNEQTRLRRRLSLYTLTGRQTLPPERPANTVLGRSQVARGAVELAGRFVQQRDVDAALGRRLEAAGLPLRAAEWIIIHAGCTLGLGLFLLLVSGGSVVPTVLGLFLGGVGPWFYLSWAESRRTSAFASQLPETLQLISGSLSAGYSFAQALDTVVREGQQPMTAEFNRALVETRLGVPIEDALEGVASRMDSRDFGWVVMAYRIQREVGGNLAELLATLAETMRERDALRRQVRALSAEGRLSAWILGLLPLAFCAYLLITRPSYLEPLVTDPLGLLMVSVGVVLLVIGTVWMRKAVRVEV